MAPSEPAPQAEKGVEESFGFLLVFEFGYFVGKLGRSRVCCLYTGDTSLPSDIAGLLYKRFRDSVEEVFYSITKELKVAGYDLSAV